MKSNVLLFPTWLDAEEAKSMIPEAAWPLISQRGSLTKYLHQTTEKNIQHRLLTANWGHATATERQALNLESAERTWVRRIEWRYQNKLWIHARAIFPESTLKATGSTISGLGVQSLGEIIFKDPELQRDPFTYSLLGKDSIYYTIMPDVIDSAQTVWARRSTLYFKNHPLLITEIFMPDSYAQRDA